MRRARRGGAVHYTWGMSDRLSVLKTYKLFIGGAFPRSESGRSMVVRDASGNVAAHASRASRKDLRAAVEAAREGLAKWAGSSAMLRGQILYRIAEMMEGRKGELAEAIASIEGGSARDEVSTSIDRLVAFAGWADKFAQVLGCNNPVAGPYYNFTSPEPSGVIGIVCPGRPSLLGLISLAAPALCAGNTLIVVASSANPLPAVVLSECLATGDLPAGAVNILTGDRSELIPWLAAHRDIEGIHASGVTEDERRVLEEGAAENLKRVRVRDLAPDEWFDSNRCAGPWWIEPFVEMKTVWHPAAT